jgi:hypothetical protein
MAERGGKLRGALAKDPGYKKLPGKPGTQRTDAKPSMGREGNMANKPTERLSPGVYRGAGGGLVTQGGKQIQRQPQAPPMQPQRPMPTSLVGESNFTPEQLNLLNYKYERDKGMDIGQIAGNIAADQSNILFGNQLNPGASAPQFDPNNPNSYQPYIGQIQNGLGQPMTMPQMPQASANQGGRYRLSPGMYGTQQQAMNQYNQQMEQFNARLPQQLMKKY